MSGEETGRMPEDELVARLTRRLPVGRRVKVRAGDDCAVVRVPGRKELQLLKTDCLVEGVHFLREFKGEQVGWKALCRTISDVAACGGKPDAALITVAAPADLDVAYLEAIYAGLRRAARRFGVSVVGGETARSPSGLVISISLTGWVKSRRMVLRSGGRAGDALFVTGKLGGSFASGRHLSFTPRVEEAKWLVSNFDIHAMMDLSDGLGTDLPRLADASRKGYAVDLAALPKNPGCAVDQAVGDGEDYELLFAVAAKDGAKLAAAWKKQYPRLPLTRIGKLLAARRNRTPLKPGYTHFSDCQPAGNSDS